jgi:hypothetical protein
VGQAWLLCGVTLLMFLSLEFGYRGLRAVRAGLRGSPPAVDSSLHPYANQPWWPELQRDLDQRQNRFDPYRSHWPKPLATRYVNIDSLGRRVTPQRAIQGPRRQLFLLGGSTAWGYTARDSATVAAFLAAELESREVRDVEVVSLAQAAFNSTQEATTLMSELARGRRPALAIFLNGYNDIATAGKYGEPGHTYGDEGIQQQIDLGLRGFGAELLGLGRHSAVVQRLRSMAGLQPPPSGQAPAGSVCGPLAGYYRQVAQIGEALGREFGFPVLYFLQPHSAVSRKPPTAWEAGLQAPRLVPPCMMSIDSAMADRRHTTFFSLVDLFDQDSTTVFIDANAHITEAANREVARRIAELAAPLLLRTGPGGQAP